MDKLAHPASSHTALTTPAPGLEQMPPDVLQHILHYLPIKGARNVFRLLSQGYLASTDYLRVAGLVRARIRSMAAQTTQAQALQRFTVLAHDCMDQRLPAGTTSSLLMELVDLLPALPTADLPTATRLVLASSKMLGERAGHEVRERCMERCITAYQHRSTTEAQLPGFVPVDDEEAALAARHFNYGLDRTVASTGQMLSHMENLCSALGWAEKVADADERVRLLSKMCRHGVTTFIMFNLMDEEFRQRGALPRAQALRSKLAQTTMRILPAQPIQAQAALLSLALEVSAKDRDAYRLAVQAACRLVRKTPDDTLLAHWKTTAKALYRAGVVKALTLRASAWPDLQGRATMLRQLAGAAYDKGDFSEMDRLCAMVTVLLPPSIDTICDLLDQHADAVGQARVEFIVCELIPSVIALPTSVHGRFTLVVMTSRYLFDYYESDKGFIGEPQSRAELGNCLASYKKLIAALFGTSMPDDELMRRRMRYIAEELLDLAYKFRSGTPFSARAAMKFKLIALLEPVVRRFRSMQASTEAIDDSSSVSQSPSAPAALERLPDDLLHAILHYLPVKTARNAFRLINRNYLAGTDYLRTAGRVQTRIRNKIATESWEQLEKHLASLITDCMNSAFPSALKHSLLMELVGTLSQLPATLHADAMQFVLAQCNAIGKQCGPATRQACMTLCIHDYQRRSECAPQLEKFWPVTDEEVRIAADFFDADIDPASVPFPQLLNHLDSLLAAMDSANGMQDSQAGDRALTMLCNHCTDTFIVIEGGTEILRKNAGWEQVANLKAAFASKALLLFPGKSAACQAALLSITLAFAGKNSAMCKQAEMDGRDLIRAIPDTSLALALSAVATSLLRHDIGEQLVERVDAWPAPAERLAMLRQLATLAWEQGAMPQMERICARICKLEPPDPVALQALVQASMSRPAAERIDCATRDVIPYLLCVPSGLPGLAAFDAMLELIRAVPELKPGMKAQQRWTALRQYAIDAKLRMLTVHYSSNERELEHSANGASSPAVVPSATMNQFIELARQLFQQPGARNAKPNE
nr:hypothetical protein [uncultured Noviherbaspirillum sp.]